MTLVCVLVIYVAKVMGVGRDFVRICSVGGVLFAGRKEPKDRGAVMGNALAFMCLKPDG